MTEWLRSTLLVGLSALALAPARASHTAQASNQIQIASTRALNFGLLLKDLGPGQSETVSFTASGEALAQGVDVLPVGGAVQPARFVISASSSPMIGQTVTVAAGAYVHATDPNQTLPWRSLQLDYASDRARATQRTGSSLVATLADVAIPTTGETLRVYGAVELEAADAGGSYTGTITVTSHHQ